MTPGELASTVIGSLGLIGGVIGFLYARAASSRASKSEELAIQAKVDAAAAQKAMADALTKMATDDPDTVDLKVELFENLANSTLYRVVNRGMLEARNVTVTSNDPAKAVMLHANETPTLPRDEAFQFIIELRTGVRLNVIDIAWEDDVDGQRTRTIRLD